MVHGAVHTALRRCPAPASLIRTIAHSGSACVSIDLPLDVFVRGADPQQVGRPVVITEQGYVCRVNPAAAELGVESGSSMSTALHISESLASFERNPDKERRTLDRLAQWAYQFTPAVSIQPPDSLLLEIGGCLKLWSGIDTLMSRIRSRVFRLGFNLTTGLGRTPLTAHLAAISNFGEGRIATPDNIGHLSVGDLSIETETIASLHNMGIRSIEQLLCFANEFAQPPVRHSFYRLPPAANRE
ncbi:MAG: DNA polymerase Y family protein [Gammaproteobacteria bacterium]|nr:DNA polymerase Y family protein [Gammaproteobacteria bacterium]